jgi:aerobic carbon-monoxide dehydrogenase medium subunit
MKPPPFEYKRPESVPEALDLLAANGDRAKVLAGGQSLVALMNLRLAAPEILIDIGRCGDLRYVRDNGANLCVGAMTTHATVEHNRLVSERCPLLARATRFIGHSAFRNRGTNGGSFAHADTAEELTVVISALEGAVTLTSLSGSRRVSAEDFFEGFLMTALRPDELLTEVSFPGATPGAGYAFDEFARRPGDFALVSVACRIQREGDAVRSTRVVLGGVAPAPAVVDGLDEAVGEDIERVVEIASRAAAEVDPVRDVHGTTDYRRHLARGLTERVVRRATAARV